MPTITNFENKILLSFEFLKTHDLCTMYITNSDNDDHDSEGLKGAVVNRNYRSINESSLDITMTVPLINQ